MAENINRSPGLTLFVCDQPYSRPEQYYISISTANDWYTYSVSDRQKAKAKIACKRKRNYKPTKPNYYVL